MDRAINAILDGAYSQAREALLIEMKRLTRVAAFLYEHERIDGAQFEALFDGTLAPSVDVERQWRSAKSKPRSWDEIDNLIASSVATSAAVAARPIEATSNSARVTAQSGTTRRRTPRRNMPATAGLLLRSLWQRAWRGNDRMPE
jgi:hypothetical protein